MTVLRGVVTSSRRRYDSRTRPAPSIEILATSPSIPRPVVLALIVAIALTLFFQPAIGYPDDDDRASSGDWIYLSIILVGTVVLVLAVVVAGSRRGVNPHTGLPAKTKRRRTRGPLKSRNR